MRLPRQLKKDASYHITVKINRDEMIFNEDTFKKLYLAIIKRAMKKYSFTIRNFCIMGNHIHMILEPLGDENLSRIMQWIQSVFAIQHNRITGLKGHVWYDRFKSKIIHDVKQLVNTFIYIALNPVKAGIITNPFEYTYNGIKYILEKSYEIISPPDKYIQMVMDQLRGDWLH